MVIKFGAHKEGEFFDQLSDYQVPKQGFCSTELLIHKTIIDFEAGEYYR
jgi:hypothetical protein